MERFSTIFILLTFLSIISAFQRITNVPSLRIKPTMAFNFNFGNFGAKQASKSTIPADKKLCVITGTTSGLGKATLKALLKKDNYYIICAVRDVEKMQAIADEEGYDTSKYTIVQTDLASFESTRQFVTKLNAIKKSRPLDRLVCNAAVYQPALDKVFYCNTMYDVYILLFILHFSLLIILYIYIRTSMIQHTSTYYSMYYYMCMHV